MTAASEVLTPEGHQAHAIQFNQRAWALLEQSERTPVENEALLHAAYASAAHFALHGTLPHKHRALWLLARVWAVLGEPRHARRYASACLAMTAQARAELKDFDLAYAREALARAEALAGHAEEADRLKQEARALGDAIQDPEDRAIFMKDLQGGPWAPVKSPFGDL